MESLRKEGNVKKTATVLVVLVVACSSPDPGTSPPGEAMVTGGRTHADLVQLYEEFRDFRVPEISEGVPDYTADAMRR